jgi:hypothetical protein
MQTQQRQSKQPAPTGKKPATNIKPTQARSAPTELDAQSLRQVAGGTINPTGPYKTW